MRTLALVLLSFGASACVTVYQPVAGLQGPTVVDPALANLEGLKIAVHCVPVEILEGQAGPLCQRMRTLFENQGAEVKTITSRGRSEDDVTFDGPLPPPQANKPGEAKEGGEEKKPPPPPRVRADLIVELRARHIAERTDTLMWTLSWFTFTLAPGISENTFVQEVDIRDGRGNPLVQSQLKGRIVRYFGLGYWGATKLINLIFRDDEEDINDEQLQKQLSNDLYGQLSQMVFNAKMRSRVLSATRAP